MNEQDSGGTGRGLCFLRAAVALPHLALPAAYMRVNARGRGMPCTKLTKSFACFMLAAPLSPPSYRVVPNKLFVSHSGEKKRETRASTGLGTAWRRNRGADKLPALCPADAAGGVGFKGSCTWLALACTSPAEPSRACNVSPRACNVSAGCPGASCVTPCRACGAKAAVLHGSSSAVGCSGVSRGSASGVSRGSASGASCSPERKSWTSACKVSWLTIVPSPSSDCARCKKLSASSTRPVAR